MPNLTAAERHADLVVEARDLLTNLTAAVDGLAAIAEPDWGDVGSVSDEVVDKLAAALSTARAVVRSHA